ncbi:MBL fold metallo-hydrolase [Lutimonas zeaxanthinifaciens]|uniref:MBL fold metallo-hydrolase n=1 Tax=Lutimonas zeaxanthinifaciens TaxID=3060215 RepID=UPI00265CC8B1|nr:MBL fold metallo-hydrolase [Lutimonas sp. YSD2104]WKK64756.1 MBL fold metallo-hydrolase [Lutimonas sp. YSD2104]
MKITFLGTGTSQGIPVIGSKDEVCLSTNQKDKRLRSSLMMEWDNQVYVIDCGPDFRQQLLTAGASRLDGILFTHYHADHTAGLDDIRPFSLRNGFVKMYMDQTVADNLKERFAYIFATENRYAGAPNVSIEIFENKSFNLGGKEIYPVEVMHGWLRIFGFRIDKMAYVTDAKTVSEREKEKLKGLDVLIVNALRIDPHPTHFNLEEALEFIAELKPQKAYLTHISHRLGFHERVSKQLPPNVFLAYDGLQVEINA